LLILVAINFSCASPKFTTNSNGYNKLNLDFYVDFIVIKDKRKEVSIGNDIYLPGLSRQNQNEVFHPPINDNHEKILKQTVFENTNNSSKHSSIITIQLIQGRKEFYAKNFAENEISVVEIKVISQLDDKKYEAQAAGEYSMKSIDATYKRSERIYQNALKEVTYNALEILGKKISG